MPGWPCCAAPTIPAVGVAPEPRTGPSTRLPSPRIQVHVYTAAPTPATSSPYPTTLASRGGFSPGPSTEGEGRDGAVACPHSPAGRHLLGGVRGALAELNTLTEVSGNTPSDI